MTLRAVVFDCDGVLADSEELFDDAWRAALDEYGRGLRDEDALWSKGRTDRALFERLNTRHPMPPWDEFHAAIDRHLDRIFAEHLQPFPDAAETVPALAFEGIPLAVASSSRRSRLDLILDLIGLRRYFEFTVAGDEVTSGKPDPEIYLAGAAGIGVAPAECMAVEDAAAGAAAARGAGMRVIVVDRPGAPPVSGFSSTSQLDPELILTWMGLR
jgi:HAD superfamily hydrolase (TIGR01509 family)